MNQLSSKTFRKKKTAGEKSDLDASQSGRREKRRLVILSVILVIWILFLILMAGLT